MSRRPLAVLYDSDESKEIFCGTKEEPLCEHFTDCPKTGFPKVTPANRRAFREYQTKQVFGAYLPRPFYATLRERVLIIDSEIAKIQAEEARQNARTASTATGG